MINSDLKDSIKIFSEKYKPFITPIVLIIGFIADVFTLNRVDQVFDNLILITHIVIVGTTIILLFGKETAWGHRLNIVKHSQNIQYLMLFSFGALFSGSIIFFSKSASLTSSWPFFLLLLVLMLGTEFQRKYFQRLILQVNFYFITVFSYLIVVIPVLMKDMGPKVFVVSGLSSLLFMFFFFSFLYFLDKQTIKKYIKKMSTGIILIFLMFNFLYFTNIIPPIPLSLKKADVYHTVYKTSDFNYVGIYEPGDWWNPFNKISNVINRKDGESVYVFSSVFAPVNLKTKIFHQWQYFDFVKNKWVDSSRIPIFIQGGREGGFRGYSYKESLTNGKWRVFVETERRQKLGQIKFKIQDAKGEVVLKEDVL